MTFVIEDPTRAFWFGIPFWIWVLGGGIALFGAFQAYYWIGRRLGEKLYDSRAGHKIGQARLRKIESVVEKWGALAVYGSVWVPMLRHTLPWVAGALRVSYPWYVAATALACLTWVPAWSFGMYTLIWAWLDLAAHSPITAAAAAIALAAALFAFFRWRRRRRAMMTPTTV